MKEKFLKAKNVCVEKYTKVKNKVNEKLVPILTGIVAIVAASPVAAFADVPKEDVSIATNADASSAMSNLVGIILGLSKLLGAVVAAWGVIQFGLAFKEQDSRAQVDACKTIGAGILIACAKPILKTIGFIG